VVRKHTLLTDPLFSPIPFFPLQGGRNGFRANEQSGLIRKSLREDILTQTRPSAFLRSAGRLARHLLAQAQQQFLGRAAYRIFMFAIFIVTMVVAIVFV